MSLKHRFTNWAKQALYGRSGERYRIAGHELRYVPGTRPVRLKYVNAKEWVARYDALEIRELTAGVKPGDTVIDVGANAGQYAILLSALVGSRGYVVCFEPDPGALEVLERNVALNPTLKPPRIEPIALSSDEGQSTFYLNSASANSSLARPSPEGSRAVEIATRTLDGYLEKHGLYPQWVKIDTEGAEIAILQGAVKTLASDTNFLVELHPYAWSDFGHSFGDLLDLVRSAGRRMRYLDRSDELIADPTYGVVALERVIGS